MEAAEREGGLTAEIAGGDHLGAARIGTRSGRGDPHLLDARSRRRSGAGWRRALAAGRRGLADFAVTKGRNIIVLCAAETTVAATTELFVAAAARMEPPPQIDVWLVPGAWEAFKDGNIAGYYLLLTDAANAAYDGGADVVAFAQASMAGAALDARHGIPLTSPRAALECAMELAARRRKWQPLRPNSCSSPPSR